MGLLVVVSLVCCLPRVPENPSLSGHAAAALAWQSAASHRRQDKADALLLHVRKFRRRKMTFFFCVHLTSSYRPSPLQNITARFGRTAQRLISPPPDPLIHPPS
jgi:hypothetical protein